MTGPSGGRSVVHAAQSGLEIAGLRIDLDADCEVTAYDVGPAYRDFCSGSAEAGVERIAFRLRLGAWPGRGEGCGRGFDAGGVWRYDEDAGGRYVTWMSSARGGEPVSMVKLPARERDRGEVWCGRLLWEGREEGVGAVADPFRYPLDQIILMFLLSDRGGAILHGCLAVREDVGRGVLLLGRSGAGKTTVAGMFEAAGGWQVLSDDRAVARLCEGGVRGYGTPWPGEGGQARNRGVDVAALLFLDQADRDEIEPLSAREACERMLPVTSVPWFAGEDAGRVLGTLETMAALPAWRARFTLGGSIVSMADALLESSACVRCASGG